ncbi:MAG: DUF4258 domain-containing protein [Acidobacteria bacterium]|nr:DUF4258 domain-containing protein [Acidobacteriota bacterium]
MAKRAIEKIKQRVVAQEYFISGHANEEMSDDELTTADVEEVLLHGMIRRRFTRDPRGARYEVVGPSLDGRQVAEVCRFLESGWLRIMTVYALEDESS